MPIFRTPAVSQALAARVAVEDSKAVLLCGTGSQERHRTVPGSPRLVRPGRTAAFVHQAAPSTPTLARAWIVGSSCAPSLRVLWYSAHRLDRSWSFHDYAQEHPRRDR